MEKILKAYYDDSTLNRWANGPGGGRLYGEETMLRYLEQARAIGGDIGVSEMEMLCRVLGVSYMETTDDLIDEITDETTEDEPGKETKT